MADLAPAGAALGAPLDNLVSQFAAVTYTFKQGKLALPEKDQIKALLHGQSPDEMDALATGHDREQETGR